MHMHTVALALLIVLDQSTRAQTPRTTPAESQDALALQVMLDRAGFSPGVLDGHMGTNTTKALEVFRRQGNQEGVPGGEAVTRYRITDQDAAGPFVDSIPVDLVQQASLPGLLYCSLLESLAERFHSTPALLQRLNPGVPFDAGQEIVVPNVEAMTIPATTVAITGTKPAGQRAQTADTARSNAAKPDVIVTVTKSTSALTITDAAGRVLYYAPVTTGSQHDPLPIGDWKVTGIQFNPTFRYNPDLFWDANPGHTKATIPPGPNNPVGLVWIDISREHYGLHGTPEPSTIGRTQSHGCVRLTNWDALRVAALVKPGTRVVFAE
jgi:lipoprotein-anchoring transpeptidase ErfK/SrfK